MKEYKEFLERKTHLSGNFGFDPIYMPDYLFDFQKHIVEHALRKGRCAVFADTGLGKTAIQLTLAENVIQKTNRKVLILTPLAVAFQFIIEAEKMGIESDIEYSKFGEFTKKIVLCNYERLHYFNSEDFAEEITAQHARRGRYYNALTREVFGIFEMVGIILCDRR